MLKNLFQSKEDKIKQQVEEHIAEGMKLLSEKFYNGAMIEFDKAMILAPEDVYPRLVSELETAASSGELQSALAIGLNLIKENNKDYKLANKLGNYARELKDYKQADGLYKTALKVEKKFETAFYNLAASNARVDIYDDAVKSSLSIFDDVIGYILPDYITEDPKFIETMTETLAGEKEEKVNLKIEELAVIREQKLETNNAVDATEIAIEIKKLKDNKNKILPEDVIEELQKLVKTDPNNAKQHIYNTALYALHKNKPDAAIKALNGLSPKDYDTLDLLHAIALAEKGKLEEAAGKIVHLLGQNEFNRYCNVNLGLIYRKARKRFLSTKYLIKTASLLDKSNGIYSMKDLIKLANQLFQEGNLKKSLNFFLIASSEIPDVDIWYKIGSIYIEQKKYDDAVEAFRSLLKLDPDSNLGEDKLQEIHNYYFEKGEALLEDRKYKPAEEYYLKALSVFKPLNTLKQLAIVYKQMNKPEKEKEVLEQIQTIIEENEQKELEAKRQNQIAQAKQFLAKKNYLQAIAILESVFRMKVDKKIFMQLAALYKGLKKQSELQDLVLRWGKMVEHEEKMVRYKKEQEREKSGPNEEE
jgi:tetratricopeptide (TPR) repeat protein